MRALRALVVRLAASCRPLRRDDDFDAELDSHLALHVDDNIRAGMTPDAARRHALVCLGGVAQARERQRERRLLPGLDAFQQDCGYALRGLRRQPGFTLTALLTLAGGVGATSAIFSAVNAVLLRPLPFAEPDRLVMVYGVAGRGDRRDVVSYPTFVDWRDQSRAFASLAAFANRRLTITAGGQAELVQGKLITPSFFGVLGAQPALGRAFRSDEDDPARARVVILSDGFWKRRFGGAADVLGSTIRINDSTFTVVGVMPPDFHLDPADREQLYAPLPIDANRGHGFLHGIGRLRAGVTPRQAQADLDAIAAQLARVYPRTSALRGSAVVPLVDALAGPSRPALLILLATVTLVLLIACTNVASLLLARGAARQREMAVRAALGAGRGRLARQLLTESVVLALAGGAAGLLLSKWLAQLLVMAIGTAVDVPRLDATHIDGPVLIFTLIVALATGVLFGVMPALSAASPDLAEGLRGAARTATGAHGPRLRRALVVVETALALVLLSGAGVMTRTLLTLRSAEPGFDTRRMLTLDLWLPPTRFAKLPDRAALFEAAVARVRALPGVRSAAFVANLPLGGGADSEGFRIVRDIDPNPHRQYSSDFNIVTPGYFQMMGIPVRAGRGFLDSDGPASPGVAIVNETAARRFFPDQTAVGRQIELPADRGATAPLTIVGVVADVRHAGLGEAARSEIFVDSLQSDLAWSSVALAVRTEADPSLLADSVKSALRELDPNVPVSRVDTMDAIIARSMAAPRLYSLLFAAFATAAVGLAAVGVFGLVSFSAAQRSQEMGIRVALGATRGQIMRLVVRQGVGLTAVGAPIGIAAGLAATRTLTALMTSVAPNDPATFAIVTAVLLSAAGLASYLPARRAARLDPLPALRSE